LPLLAVLLILRLLVTVFISFSFYPKE